MIRLSSVSKSYDGDSVWAVREVSLHIEQGEFLILLGESGCGKTTTLKMINRLIEPTSGHIEIDGHDVMQSNPVTLRRGIGYVFQNIGLFPHMTVMENIAVVPKLLKWNHQVIDNRVEELMELVNLSFTSFHNRLPRELSGGQRQRVGLARALAAKPKIMLMDEPFGALDPLTRDTLQDEFAKIHRRLELTTVMVTHDMTEALLMADRIAVMKQGQIIAIDTPHELLTNGHDPYVEQLMRTPKEHADRLEALMKDGGSGGANE